MPRRLALSALIVLSACGNSTFAVDAGPSDAGPTDAGPTDASSSRSDAESNDPGIACGSAECDPRIDVCCVDDASTCEPRGGCNGGQRAAITCDDVADCAEKPGSVCCLFRNTDKTIGGTQCVPLSACLVAGDYNVVLCDPSATTTCPDGGACTTYRDVVGPFYNACQ